MDLFVRPFRPADRETVLQIGAETAFFGAPIERYMEDRRLFMDAFYSYYTDYEPEHTWVACADGSVVGFLTGCVNSAAHEKVMCGKIMPLVVKKWLRGEYHTGRKTFRYAIAVAIAVLGGEIPGVDQRQYPAHLHINLLPGWRGLGLGRSLIEAYLCQLRELGIPGVHLHTTNMNATACRLYEQLGFHLLSARSTDMYTHLTGERIENRCYGMRLNMPH